MTEANPNPDTHAIAVGHEVKDASVPGILWAGVALAVGAVLAGLIVYGIFQYLADHPLATEPVNPLSETEQQQFPPAPRIEEHPSEEVQALHAQEDRLLSTYGWTDKKKGVVRIPIERAMQLQMERGFPTRKEGGK